MLLDPGGDGEDVGVEDDVAGVPAVGEQQVIGTATDRYLARRGVGLALLVERHHHSGGAVAPDLSRLSQKRVLALLKADRIDDRLARDALQPGLDDRPFRAVDHYRYARDVGLSGDQLEEGDHRLLGIEQALVHVDVDDLRAVLDLLARDHECGVEVPAHYQALERGRAGDICPLADVDERGHRGRGLELVGHGEGGRAKRQN